MQTVVETPTYLAIAGKLFGEEEREAIVATLALIPSAERSWQAPEDSESPRGPGGNGKRGGARVIYIWRNHKFPVFLIMVFPKNEKENLSKSERNALKKRADDIFDSYFRR